MSSFYGPGSGRIWLDGVHCDGTEESLIWCRHTEWGITRYSHIYDVSINCLPGMFTTPSCAFLGPIYRVRQKNPNTK